MPDPYFTPERLNRMADGFFSREAVARLVAAYREAIAEVASLQQSLAVRTARDLLPDLGSSSSDDPDRIVEGLDAAIAAEEQHATDPAEIITESDVETLLRAASDPSAVVGRLKISPRRIPEIGAKPHELSSAFHAVADIEAETPITGGAWSEPLGMNSDPAWSMWVAEGNREAFEAMRKVAEAKEAEALPSEGDSQP